MFLFFTAQEFALAVLSFIWPLWGIHRRLEQEKERVAEENSRRLEQAYRGLHARLDRGDLTEMTEFWHSISAMLDFRNEIRAVSTWPWKAGTLRSFLSALLLPIALFLLQELLSRVLAL